MKKKMLVAVIDSGVDKNDKILREKDIEDLYYDNKEFKTCYVGKINPHGTEIIKVLLKEAPDIRILSIRTLQADNRCMLSAVIQALEFCIEQNADVINLSLGSCSSTSARLKELREVCDRAIARGIVIFAADNNRNGKKSYPANFPNVIGVITPEGQKAYCKVSYQNRIIEFSDNYVYVPDDMRCIIRRGNSYLCPFVVGLFCRFVDENKVDSTKYVHAFLDFLECFSDSKNISKIFFDKKDEAERFSLNGKKVLFFTDDMDYNNLQMYHMYQEVCDIQLCFEQFIKIDYEKIEKFLQGIDVFFIGALSNRFINANQEYLIKLLNILVMLQIEVITVFPIVNTYERMLLTQNSDGTIKSIYK
uniref:S8 family serine peptidase n=1 Tax=Agathobacter sp. TaxID=2021311 RepID=UPI004055F27C